MCGGRFGTRKQVLAGRYTKATLKIGATHIPGMGQGYTRHASSCDPFLEFLYHHCAKDDLNHYE